MILRHNRRVDASVVLIPLLPVHSQNLVGRFDSLRSRYAVYECGPLTNQRRDEYAILLTWLYHDTDVSAIQHSKLILTSTLLSAVTGEAVSKSPLLPRQVHLFPRRRLQNGKQVLKTPVNGHHRLHTTHTSTAIACIPLQLAVRAHAGALNKSRSPSTKGQTSAC